MRIRSFAVISAILFVFMVMAGVGFSQTASGNLAGTVKDATGAVIPNATVTAVNEDTNISYSGKGNSSGDVLIPNLPYGNYDVTASSPGFTNYTLKGLHIEVRKSSTANLTLSVSSATSVEVSAVAAVSLDTTSANLTQTFEPAELKILPSATVGLGVLNVSLLSPGVASNGGIGAGTGPSVGGQRPRNNNYTIEGIDNNDKGVTGPLVYIPNDAVGEFSLITNQFSPEFGHSSGGQFSTSVISGTNKFHGAAYEYFQNRNLNAENVPAGQHQPNPRFDYNRYGGQVGGPILKDKLFFFGNYERQTTGQSLQSYVCTPTAAGLTQIQAIPGLNATNVGQYVKYTPASPSQVDASADVACFNQATGPQTISIFSGTGNSGDGSGTGNGPVLSANVGSPSYASGTQYNIPVGNYLVSSPTFINFGALTTSGDWTISPTDNLRVRYLYNSNTQQDTAAALPVFYQPLPLRYHLVSISEFHTFTPNLTNEFRVGFTRFTQTYSAGNYKYPGLDSFPNIYIYDQNGLDYGPDDNAPQTTVQNLYQAVDNISWIKGKHNFKVGFDGRKFIAPQTFTQRVRGDYEYNYLTEYLHDLAPTSFGERSTGNFVYYGDQTALYGYVNDTWRVAPTLTLNYGLRYEFTSVPVGERAQSLNSAASVPGLIKFSSPQPQYTNFAPRVGINYAPDGKTSIRAAFGIAQDVLFDNLGLLSFPPQYSSTNDVGTTPGQPIPGDPNFLTNGGLPAGNGALATFCQDGTGPGTGVPCAQDLSKQRAATAAYMPDQIIPYAETWSLGVQRVFASNYTAEVRYVGTRGIHLPTQIQLNVQPKVNAGNQLFTSLNSPALIETNANASNLAQIVAGSNILPKYAAAGFTGKITSYQPYSGSSYNGLQTNLTRRFQHGFLLNASYTWSKTMDDATAEVFSTVLTPRRPQDSQNVNADYSRSALDRTHRLTVAAVYDLPYFKHSNWLKKNIIGNWEFSPIYTYESPEYATALSGVNSNLNGDSAGIDRPIINPNGKKGTGSGVTPVYSINLASNCGAGVATCNGNLVGYTAINPNAYYIQAGKGTLPTAGRNTLPIRPIDNFDLSASKRINITEGLAIEFQAQAFNVLNHPQYTAGKIDQIDLTSTQGTSTQFQTVSNPAFNHPELLFNPNARQMQLAAKLSF
ncbi:carboxypeptidase regulatory-like domain-containing protein [Edaphobacter paludis]|uniref:Carboxypeptidase regulatory-like domain-containing protein n=1 Tax=Edaphobacter paludis TaxID=3035702 RepID=A0AAU7D8C7_9BACT